MELYLPCWKISLMELYSTLVENICDGAVFNPDSLKMFHNTIINLDPPPPPHPHHRESFHQAIHK
jgi:hypothetical protein